MTAAEDVLEDALAGRERGRAAAESAGKIVQNAAVVVLGERAEKPQSEGGPAGAGIAATSIEIDDEDDDEDDVDPSTGAGEGLAPPAGETPVDISKPKAQSPPPPPPPFTGSNTLGPAVVDETVAGTHGDDDRDDAVDPATERNGSASTAQAPFPGSNMFGLGVAEGRDASAAETPEDEPTDPGALPAPAEPGIPATESEPGAEDAPA